MTTKTKRVKPVKYVTPFGIFKFPKLTQPDYGTKEYPKPDGDYNTRVILDGSSSKFLELLGKMEPIMATARDEAELAFGQLDKKTRDKFPHGVTMNPLFDKVYDDQEEPTGEVEMRFKMKASGVRKDEAKTKWTSRPAVWDSKNQKWDNTVDIWGGTEGRVMFTMRPYFIPATGIGGVSMQLVEAQIKVLVSKGSAASGFDEVEGGADIDDHREESFGSPDGEDQTPATDGADDGNF